MVCKQQVALFSSTELVQHCLEPWHQHLQKQFGSSQTEDEATCDFLQALVVKLSQTLHNYLLHHFVKIRTAITANRKPRSARCDFWSGHLLKTLQKQAFKLHEQFDKVSWNLTVSLEYSKQIKCGRTFIQSFDQVFSRILEERLGASVDRVKTVK